LQGRTVPAFHAHVDPGLLLDPVHIATVLNNARSALVGEPGEDFGRQRSIEKPASLGRQIDRGSAGLVV
ncbi:MAG: hypothetical protein P8P20_11300, partial [Acidimicrobiales bacterium]|nr:hypothetical protein [Acidimicrobiales bacterium]